MGSFAENKGNTEKIEKYLKDKIGEEAAKKILERIAKKLGVEAWAKIALGSFPAAALAKFATSYLWMFYYEGYYMVNGPFLYNPADPADKSQEAKYTEYLIYSCGRSEIDKRDNPNLKTGSSYIYNDLHYR